MLHCQVGVKVSSEVFGPCSNTLLKINPELFGTFHEDFKDKSNFLFQTEKFEFLIFKTGCGKFTV